MPVIPRETRISARNNRREAPNATLSVGAVAGIAIGCLTIIITLCLLLCVFYRRRRSRKSGALEQVAEKSYLSDTVNTIGEYNYYHTSEVDGTQHRAVELWSPPAPPAESGADYFASSPAPRGRGALHAPRRAANALDEYARPNVGPQPQAYDGPNGDQNPVDYQVGKRRRQLDPTKLEGESKMLYLVQCADMRQMNHLLPWTLFQRTWALANNHWELLSTHGTWSISPIQDSSIISPITRIYGPSPVLSSLRWWRKGCNNFDPNNCRR